MGGGKGRALFCIACRPTALLPGRLWRVGGAVYLFVLHAGHSSYSLAQHDGSLVSQRTRVGGLHCFVFTPWFPLTQLALTFLSSLSPLFPSLPLLPPPPLCADGHLFPSPTTFAHIARRQLAAAGTLLAGANSLRQTEQRRATTSRAAYGGCKRRPR